EGQCLIQKQHQRGSKSGDVSIRGTLEHERHTVLSEIRRLTSPYNTKDATQSKTG
ncbi:hypothetical protein BaRGS_00000658, partial [Batillaria attramentaria]